MSDKSKGAGGRQGAANNRLPRLYGDFAAWFPVLTAPEDYAEEAETYRKTIADACSESPKTLLELGSGGGNNASHLKAHFEMTLSDLSDDILDVSHALNSECEHIQGDMRNIRLGRLFDAVFIHDAISYIITEGDLRSTIETAFIHCKPGGAALFAPDCVRETFRHKTDHGGHDKGEQSLRYLEWIWDPDPNDTSYIIDFAYLMREGEDVRCEYDRHVMGLFGREDWLRYIREAGFEEKALPFEHSEIEPGIGIMFLGIKPR